MKANSYNPSAHARLNSISKEIHEISAQVVCDLTRFQQQPELIDELIRRCDSLLSELNSLRAAGSNPYPTSMSGSSSGSGVQA